MPDQRDTDFLTAEAAEKFASQMREQELLRRETEVTRREEELDVREDAARSQSEHSSILTLEAGERDHRHEAEIQKLAQKTDQELKTLLEQNRQLRADLEASRSIARDLSGRLEPMNLAAKNFQSVINGMELRTRQLTEENSRILQDLGRAREREAKACEIIQDLTHQNGTLRAKIEVMTIRGNGPLYPGVRR
jgi:hypothetical protein